MGYLDDMRSESAVGSGRGRALGCSAFGWILVAVLAAVAVFFAYRFFVYVRAMRSGETVLLPQFESRQTVGGETDANVPRAVDAAGLATADSAALGASPEDARLTVVEFGDFGCPFSRDVAVPLRSVMERNKDRVRLVYRHYPIVSLNSAAEQAAEAAECAGEQGQFWAMHDKLYQNQEALGFTDLVRYAGEIGLDSGVFETCLTGGRYRERVERDRQAAESLGLPGTPTFFFNGQLVRGAIPADVLDEIVATYLK